MTGSAFSMISWFALEPLRGVAPHFQVFSSKRLRISSKGKSPRPSRCFEGEKEVKEGRSSYPGSTLEAKGREERRDEREERGKKENIKIEKDPSQAPLEDNERVMLAFVIKAIKTPDAVTQEDVNQLHGTGWADRDILIAYNRNLKRFRPFSPRRSGRRHLGAKVAVIF